VDEIASAAKCPICVESSRRRCRAWAAISRDIVPGTKTPAQLSRQFLGQPFQGRKFTHYVEIDVTGVNVMRGREGVFVIPNDTALDISRRIISSGTVY
jgi:hypothetical protein